MMKIDREELAGLLKLLSPAVANTKNQVAELSHVWFSGTHVTAFNDILGIMVEFPTEFTGGLLGDKLIGLVERSSAKTVDIGVDGDNALIKIGRGRFNLTCRPISDWFWKPEVPKEAGYDVTPAFRDAIKLAMLSVGSTNVVSAEQRGVAVVQNGKTADLYGTDAVSLSWAWVSTGNQPIAPANDRLILPTPFCEQLLSLKGGCELRYDGKAAYCLADVDLVSRKLENNEQRDLYKTLVFSRLEEEENPVSYDEVIDRYVTDDAGIEIPVQLKAAVDRALVMLVDEPLEVYTENGELYLHATTPYGEVNDRVKFEKHPDVEAKVDASLLARALEGQSKILISTDGVVIRGPKNFIHIISNK